jgi:glycyl-tRNA synthetase
MMEQADGEAVRSEPGAVEARRRAPDAGKAGAGSRKWAGAAKKGGTAKACLSSLCGAEGIYVSGGTRMDSNFMDKLVALCKGRGFIFPGSVIYGGLANTWDYGPLGVEFKNNVKKAWWQKFIQECPHNVGLDSAILMNPQTWVASGHVGNFNDPLMDCRACKARFRADKLIEENMLSRGVEPHVDGWSNDKLEAYIRENNIVCPECGKHDFTSIRRFNLMFKTFQGVTEDSRAEIYLRPETAQGIFVNFKHVLRSSRKRVPFGIGQIGKSFRNEITPGNFTFRTREFEQMELEIGRAHV